MNRTEIKVYMLDGRVYKYYVSNPTKGKKHAHRIVTEGWRNVEDGVMEYYPAWQILKVTFPDPGDELSEKYEGKASDG